MADQYHQPVLVKEVLHYLIGNTEGIFIDGTAGGGGHSLEILKRLGSKGRLIAIDRDSDAVDACGKRLDAYNDKVTLIKSEFGRIADILTDLQVGKVDGFFLDLGISSFQIDTPERGFSFQTEGPLDMRMDKCTSRCASDIVNSYSEEELADLFYDYGEERLSRRIAKAVCLARNENSIETSQQLANVVKKCVHGKFQVKSLARIWQSLRLEVNGELQQLQDALTGIYPFLNEGARIVTLSYHSLEDRICKRFFRGETPDYRRSDGSVEEKIYQFTRLNKKVIRATKEEIRSNPRASAAKLRSAERI